MIRVIGMWGNHFAETIAFASASISDRTHALVSSAFTLAAASNSARSSSVRRTCMIAFRACSGDFFGRPIGFDLGVLDM